MVSADRTQVRDDLLASAINGNLSNRCSDTGVGWYLFAVARMAAGQEQEDQDNTNRMNAQTG